MLKLSPHVNKEDVDDRMTTRHPTKMLARAAAKTARPRLLQFPP